MTSETWLKVSKMKGLNILHIVQTKKLKGCPITVYACKNIAKKLENWSDQLENILNFL